MEDLRREVGIEDSAEEEMEQNYYGSPVAIATRRLQAVSTNEATSQPILVPLNRVTCSCSTMCSKKTGKYRGCPCRDEGLRCHFTCKCGDKKPCKNNKESNIVRGNLPVSAFDQHRNEERQSNEEIKKFLSSISEAQKDTLLVELLSNGRGSLDFAMQLTAAQDDGEPQPEEEGRPDWCKCSVCRDMGNDVENKCCGKAKCVTSYELFRNICIDREVLRLAVRARCDIRAEEPDYSMSSFRKAAYRQYILWRYGKLGKGNRRVCPACVVTVVRGVYPAPDGQYMGFRQR